MRLQILLSTILCLTTVAYGFVCPTSVGYTFHADIASRCEVYYICYNGQRISLRCPKGLAFDDMISRCVDASYFVCKEVEQVKVKPSDAIVYSIAKVQAKESAKESSHHSISDMKDILKEEYLGVYSLTDEIRPPKLKSIKSGMLSVAKHNVLLKKRNPYKRTGEFKGRIVKKLYKPRMVPGSTDTNLAKISKNSLAAIQLGKHLPYTTMQTRAKRSIILSRPLFDVVSSFVQPFAKVFFKSIARSICGDDPFFKEYALPMLFEMLDDSQSMAQIREIVWIAKNIYAPISNLIFKGQPPKDADDKCYKMAISDLDRAKFKFFGKIEPILQDIIERHLQMILLRTAQYLPLITDTIEHFGNFSGEEGQELKYELMHFFAKHSEFFLTNDASFRNVMNFVEMRNDLLRIKIKLVKIFMAYLSHSPTSILYLLFNKNSALSRLFN